ncbi:NB-ARC domain-containing protein [Neochlamydia sp. S13]|uniref:NB-ARC domain-containing protein n=1 Tax=Neochlamydia sp. S13 TaxID=1353976 RepID=UPI0005A997B4|nr:NB-ARC domain-containing protein [Neochlamydia sp. S13]
MSISSSKSAFPLSRGLYSKLGSIPSFSAGPRVISSLFYSKSISTAFHGLYNSHSSTSLLGHHKINCLTFSGISQNQGLRSYWTKRKYFCRPNFKDKLQPSAVRVFKGQRRLHTEIKEKSGNEERIKSVREYISQKQERFKNMTSFEKQKLFIGTTCSVLVLYVLRPLITDYVKKAFKEETVHVGLSDEISSQQGNWIQTKNLDKLEEFFKEPESNIQKVAIVGMAGSGRTTLAKRYAMHYEKKMKEQPDRIRTVFFADMRDEDTFLHAYRKLAEDLGVHVPLAAQEEVIIKKVNKKLARRPYWLFVVDNVDAKSYEKLQKFFPNNKKGKILLVTKEKLNGAEPFDMQSNTLSMQEALDIFNLNLGDDHWALKKANNSKRQLASELFYLPLVIKQAAIYLKDAPQDNSFDASIESYVKRLKEVAGISEKVSLRSIDDATRIIKAVHSLSVEECEQKQSESKALLSIIPFLNPYFIDRSILQLWFDKHVGNTSLFNPILDLLESYALIAMDGEDGWEVHSSLQELLIEKAEKQGVKPSETLKELLVFFRNNFKLDMRFADGLNKTKAIENQLETLLRHAEKYELQEELKPYFVHLYNVLGNYYLQSNNFFEARQAFKKSLKLVKVQINHTTAEQICDNLKAHKELPALCAQALHYLGKVYFHTQGLDQAKKYFQKAIDIQEVITTQRDGYDNPNPFDFIVFQRQGKGWALLEGDKDDLLQAEKLYLNLFKQNPSMPAGQRDLFNERYCNIQLSRVYLKLAQQEADKEKKEEYYNKARERLEIGGIEKGVPFQGAIQMMQQYVRSGEICLMLGELYLDKDCPFGDLGKAQDYFEKASQLSKNDLMIGAKSKYYLARLYLEKGLSHQAFKAINESIQLFNKVGGKGLTRIRPKGFYEAVKIKEAFRNDAPLIL